MKELREEIAEILQRGETADITPPYRYLPTDSNEWRKIKADQILALPVMVEGKPLQAWKEGVKTIFPDIWKDVERVSGKIYKDLTISEMFEILPKMIAFLKSLRYFQSDEGLKTLITKDGWRL